MISDLRWIAIILSPIALFSLYPRLSPFYSEYSKRRWTIYLGIIIAVVTMAVDTIFRALLDRWPVTAVVIPLIASAAGVAAGWWALHNTMGGPS